MIRFGRVLHDQNDDLEEQEMDDSSVRGYMKRDFVRSNNQPKSFADDEDDDYHYDGNGNDNDDNNNNDDFNRIHTYDRKSNNRAFRSDENENDDIVEKDKNMLKSIKQWNVKAKQSDVVQEVLATNVTNTANVNGGNGGKKINIDQSDQRNKNGVDMMRIRPGSPISSKSEKIKSSVASNIQIPLPGSPRGERKSGNVDNASFNVQSTQNMQSVQKQKQIGVKVHSVSSPLSVDIGGDMGFVFSQPKSFKNLPNLKSMKSNPVEMGAVDTASNVSSLSNVKNPKNDKDEKGKNMEIFATAPVASVTSATNEQMNSTTPIGCLNFSHAKGRIQEYEFYLQTFTDTEGKWGEISSLFHVPHILNREIPREHHPIIMSNTCHVVWTVELVYFFMYPENYRNLKYMPVVPIQGTVTFKLITAPIFNRDRTHNSDNVTNGYSCTITEPNKYMVKNTNSTHSVLVHNNVIFEAMLIPNGVSDIANLKKSNYGQYADISILNFRVGYQPTSSDYSLFGNSNALDFDWSNNNSRGSNTNNLDDIGHTSEKTKHEYRLYWVARVKGIYHEL